MKRNKSYQYRSQKKKGKALPIVLISLGVIVAGIIVWIGMNDWNLAKSYKEIERVIYQDDSEVDNETTNPDGNSDSEIIDENNEAEEPENE